MKVIREYISLVFLSILLPGVNLAKVVEVKSDAEHIFNPSISEEVACEIAKSKLVANAARSGFGETVVVDERQYCSTEQAVETGFSCKLDQLILLNVSEDISLFEIRDLDLKVSYPLKTKRYACRVTGTVVFEDVTSLIDTAWITKLKASSSKSESGAEEWNLDISSTKDGYHYIFLDLGADGFSLVFPNILDIQNRFVGEVTIPRSNSRRKWSINSQAIDRQLDGGASLVKMVLLSSRSELKSITSLVSNSYGRSASSSRLPVIEISRDRLKNLKESLKSKTWTQDFILFRMSDLR